MACVCCSPPCCFSADHHQRLPSASVTYTHTRLSSSLFLPNRSGTQSPLLDNVRRGSGPQPFTSLVETISLSATSSPANQCGTRLLSGSAPRPFVFYGTSPPTLQYYTFNLNFSGSLEVVSPLAGGCFLNANLPPPSPGEGALSVDLSVFRLTRVGFSWPYNAAQGQYTATYYWHGYTRLDTQATPPCVLCCDWLNGPFLGSETDFGYDTTVSATPRQVSCFAYNGNSIQIDIAVTL